jgi:hypothetical protein
MGEVTGRGRRPSGDAVSISPRLEYDVMLNAFFQCPSMVGSAGNTQVGYAQDLSKFLTFLWSARGGRS